jgi:hypothetical protein
MKKALFLTIFVVFATIFAFSDEITFSFIEFQAPFANVSVGPAGGLFGPALNIMVSDTTEHMQFPLTGSFNAVTSAATNITTTATEYSATFAEGGSLSITSAGTTFISGTPIFADSHLESLFADDTGTYRGEFLITHVDPSVLAKFHLGPEFKPDGAVSITFGQSAVTGDHLDAVIGGGTVTVETPTVAPIPEVATLFLFGTCLLVAVGTFSRIRRNVTN